MFDDEVKEFLEKLNAFHDEKVYEYFEIHDTYAVHRDTGYRITLHDCDGIAFKDVCTMYIYQYCIENGLDITKISFD